MNDQARAARAEKSRALRAELFAVCDDSEHDHDGKINALCWTIAELAAQEAFMRGENELELSIRMMGARQWIDSKSRDWLTHLREQPYEEMRARIVERNEAARARWRERRELARAAAAGAATAGESDTGRVILPGEPSGG